MRPHKQRTTYDARMDDALKLAKQAERLAAREEKEIDRLAIAARDARALAETEGAR